MKDLFCRVSGEAVPTYREIHISLGPAPYNSSLNKLVVRSIPYAATLGPSTCNVPSLELEYVLWLSMPRRITEVPLYHTLYSSAWVTYSPNLDHSTKSGAFNLCVRL